MKVYALTCKHTLSVSKGVFRADCQLRLYSWAVSPVAQTLKQPDNGRNTTLSMTGLMERTKR